MFYKEFPLRVSSHVLHLLIKTLNFSDITGSQMKHSKTLKSHFETDELTNVQPNTDKPDTHAQLHIQCIIHYCLSLQCWDYKSLSHRVFISLEHSQIKWELHFFFLSYLLNRKTERKKLGPYHSLQTQQWEIIRFVSTFCPWHLIRVTSSTL